MALTMVQPKLLEIREKYADDKMKQQQAMMELYKTEKINPLGGCLPIVIQIPVFIALYWVLLSSVEMRNAPWIGWITDLAAQDPWYILPVLMTLSSLLQTALNPVIVLELIATGVWSGVGVQGPETMPPQPFLDKLVEYGSPWGQMEVAAQA